MTETNIAAFPQTKAPKAKGKKVAKVARAVSARMTRRIKLQHTSAAVIALVAAGMTAVSLQHIAGTFVHQTAIAEWQSWAMAAGIDVNYIGMEMAGVVAAMQHTRDRLHRFTRFGIPAVMLFSQACNVLEFTASADMMTTQFVFGAIAGVMLPIGTWLGFRVAAILAEV